MTTSGSWPGYWYANGNFPRLHSWLIRPGIDQFRVVSDLGFRSGIWDLGDHDEMGDQQRVPIVPTLLALGFPHNFKQFMHILPHAVQSVPLVAEWLITFLTVPGDWAPRATPPPPPGLWFLRSLRDRWTNLAMWMTLRNDRLDCFWQVFVSPPEWLFHKNINYCIIYAEILLANEPGQIPTESELNGDN